MMVWLTTRLQKHRAAIKADTANDARIEVGVFDLPNKTTRACSLFAPSMHHCQAPIQIQIQIQIHSGITAASLLSSVPSAQQARVLLLNGFSKCVLRGKIRQRNETMQKLRSCLYQDDS